MQTDDPTHDCPEAHQLGTGTTERRISHKSVAALWDHGISWVGCSAAGPEFRFVRWRPAFAQLLVTFRGCGQVWCGGTWTPLPPGRAYITPPGRFHAYAAAGHGPKWEVGWVVAPAKSPAPFLRLPPEPHVVEVDHAIFEAAISGMVAEAGGPADFAMLDCWARIVRNAAVRAIGASPHDELIDQLWRKVTCRLDHPWTLAEMAETLGCSEEHLRRLSHRRFGCSPMRRLLTLRMQQAAALLGQTNLTIAAIGRMVGYENEFAFSNAFKRWSRGVPPSHYRRRTFGHDGTVRLPPPVALSA